MLGAGKFNQRITIQQPTTSTVAGEAVTTWSTLATVWASVAHRGGREFYAASRRLAETSCLLVIRWRSDVLPTHRILFGARILEILEAGDPDGRKEVLQIVCTEAK